MPRIHIPFLYPEAAGLNEARCREEGRKALAIIRDKVRPALLGKAPTLIEPRKMIETLGLHCVDDARGPAEIDLEVWGAGDADLHPPANGILSNGELAAYMLTMAGHYWLHYLCVRERFMDGKGLQIPSDPTHFGRPDTLARLEASWFAEELALPEDTLRAAVAKYGFEDTLIFLQRHAPRTTTLRRLAQLGLSRAPAEQHEHA